MQKRDEVSSQRRLGESGRRGGEERVEQQRGECITEAQVCWARKKRLVFKAEDEATNGQPS